MNDHKWPLTLLRSNGSGKEEASWTRFLAPSATELIPILDRGRMVGHYYDTKEARFCLLGDVGADDPSASRRVQTRQVFEKMEQLLQKTGMDFCDTVRTWFYLDELLEWYDEFNAVRTQFFQERGTFQKMVPASTGIGAKTPLGRAIRSALFAVKPTRDVVQVSAVPSPLQGAAEDYKSSFSRAVEIRQPNIQLLLISGTASIAPHGSTMHIDNPAEQIERSMEVVHALLRSRGMDWQDASRAIAYCTSKQFATLFEEYCRDKNLPPLPITYSHADICRHDLLFEIELDAIRHIS